MLASNVFLNCRSNYFDCDAVDLGDAHSLGIGNDTFDLVVLALYSVSFILFKVISSNRRVPP